MKIIKGNYIDSNKVGNPGDLFEPGNAWPCWQSPEWIEERTKAEKADPDWVEKITEKKAQTVAKNVRDLIRAGKPVEIDGRYKIGKRVLDIIE